MVEHPQPSVPSEGMQGPCPFCGGFFLDYPRHLEEEYAKKAHEAERERQLRAASALAIPADPPTGQVPPGYVVVPEAVVNRPLTINDLPSPFEKGVSVSERLKRINDKLNYS